MTTATVDTYRRPVPWIASRFTQLAQDGYEVVLIIGDSTPPERILKVVAACVGNYKVQFVVKHAELEEYFRNAAIGATIGAGVGAAGYTATKLLAFSKIGGALVAAPIALPALLAAIGLGALIGAATGAAVTPLAEVKIYKFRGETRVKFSQSTDIIAGKIEKNWPFPS